MESAHDWRKRSKSWTDHKSGSQCQDKRSDLMTSKSELHDQMAELLFAASVRSPKEGS